MVCDINAVDQVAFLKDIIDVCRRHGLVIGHEDHEGSFVVYDYSVFWERQIMSSRADVANGGAK